MKLMKRIKDILFDEEEVEIPVIEESTKKERKLIDNEEKIDSITEIKMPDDDFSDKENLKSELTFPFPIEFDEDELERTKPIETFRQSQRNEEHNEQKSIRDNYNSYSRYDVKKEERPRRPEREIKDYSSYLKTKEEKKQFKPTPIISPVYGVLDQNYKKEDLIVKDEIKRKPSNKAKLDLDEIRKKAYGTETKLPEEVVEVEETKELEIIEDEDIFIDPNKTIGELIEEESIIFNDLDNTKEEELPQVELSDLIKEKEDIEKKLDTQVEDDDDETDLFSLIDSMYEENNE